MFEKLKALLKDALKHTNKQTPTNDQKSSKTKLQQAIEHLNELEQQEEDAKKTIDGLKEQETDESTGVVTTEPVTSDSDSSSKNETTVKESTL